MAKLSSQQRKNLSSSSFVYPGQRRYPIHDIKHARNALSRVSAYGSPSEKAKVRAAVHKKYPSIGHSKGSFSQNAVKSALHKLA